MEAAEDPDATSGAAGSGVGTEGLAMAERDRAWLDDGGGAGLAFERDAADGGRRVAMPATTTTTGAWVG